MATAPLLDMARQVGGITWYLRQTFSLLGSWARDDESPAFARVLATRSNHHGELATACYRRLPTITLTSGQVLMPEQFITAPSDDDEAMVSKLDLGTRPEVRLDAARALTTRILELVDAHRADVDERLDEPTASLLDDVADRLRAHLAVA